MHIRKRKAEKELRTVYKSKLFRRYFLIMVLIIMACLISLGMSMLLLVTNYWWNEKFELLHDNSKSLVTIAVDKNIFEKSNTGVLKDVGETLSLMSRSTQSDYFICDDEGAIVVCPETAQSGMCCRFHRGIHLTDSEQGKELSGALNKGFTNYTSLNDSLDHACFVVATPIASKGRSFGAVIAVEDVMVGLLPYVKSITKMFAASAIVSLGIAFIASYAFSYGVAKPLSEMTDATKAFAKGKFDIRVREEHKKGEMRQLAQSLNKMASDLEVEDAAKKSFVANVSHELKTPMTTIGGFIDGILDGTIPEDRQREYLFTVSAEVKRLSRLVVAMLNLSKIESGEIQLVAAEYDLLTQMLETMLPFERIIEKNGIAIEGFENLEGIKICADRDLLHQVIYNLIDNAVKFTPKDGTISLYAQSDERCTTVTIRNSGSGVSGDEIKHIFERFYKVDKSRSFDVKGVGLGLYIVKTIINMHGGTISADSKVNEYTEFCFSIPFKQENILQ